MMYDIESKHANYEDPNFFLQVRMHLALVSNPSDASLSATCFALVPCATYISWRKCQATCTVHCPQLAELCICPNWRGAV